MMSLNLFDPSITSADKTLRTNETILINMNKKEASISSSPFGVHCREKDLDATFWVNTGPIEGLILVLQSPPLSSAT